MCWYVEFSVDMSGNSPQHVENVERAISGFKINAGRRTPHEVQLTKGSVEDGYHTSQHCDCDHVRVPEKDRGVGHSLTQYPELFQQLLDLPGVKKIRVHWYWSKDEPKEKEEKLTISEFFERNNASKLSSLVEYKILKEKYY